MGRPYRPQGRGKVERLFATIQSSFLPEFYELLKQEALSLEELNEYLWVWLDKYYHEKVHSATKQAPRLRFETDTNPLRTVTLEELYDAFLLEEKRSVDKTMLFSVLGRTFQTEPELAKKKINVRYDPYELEKVQVYSEGKRYPDAFPFVMPEHGIAPSSDREKLTTENTVSSGLNFLSILRGKHKQGLSFSQSEVKED